MPAPTPPPILPPLPLLGQDGDRCSACAAPLAVDQRYCLNCGARRGAARLDVVAAARQRAQAPRTVIHAPPPAPQGWWPAGAAVGPRLAAALCLAMLTGGMALGAAAGPNAPDTFAAGGRRIVAVVRTPPPAAPVVAVTAPPTVDDAAGSVPEPESPDSAAVTDDAATTDDDAASADAVDTPSDTEANADDVPADADPETSDGPVAAPVLPAASPLPPVKHVWVVMLTGQRYAETWGPKATDPALRALAARGTVLSRVFGVAHGTLPSGVALLSGQGPNPATQSGCAASTALSPGTLKSPAEDPLQQAAGTGCIYPATVPTLPQQLTRGGLTWRAYVESIASPVPGEPQSCRHPPAGASDPFTAPRPGDAYLTARNPFVAFAALTEDVVDCAANVVGVDRLGPDLATPDQTPALSYIVPDACHDGSELPCAPGAPAGLTATSPWLIAVVDQITATDAYKDHGLIIVTGDQAPADGPLADARGCLCTMAPDGAGSSWPNTTDPGAPAAAPDPAAPPGRVARAPRGGGRVGALLLSPFVTPGRTVLQGYDHVSLLKSIEDLFGLPHLGAANDPAHKPFGPGVYAEYIPPGP